MRFTPRVLVVMAAAGHLGAATVLFDVRQENSVIAVRTDKAGLLSAFGAGHRHGIVAKDFTVRLCADPRTLEGGSVNVVVLATSLTIDSPAARRAAGVPQSGPSEKDVPVIQQKMLSPANLDASAHPEIRFDSSAVSPSPGGLTLRGTLKIRGRANPVTVPLRVERPANDYRFTGNFDIKLSDFGITPESVGGVVKVADQLTVLLDLVARPGKEACH